MRKETGPEPGPAFEWRERLQARHGRERDEGRSGVYCIGRRHSEVSDEDPGQSGAGDAADLLEQLP